MGSAQEDFLTLKKVETLKDELDGFRMNIKNKMKKFFCSSSSLSPTNPAPESPDYVQMRTALTTSTPKSKTLHARPTPDDNDSYPHINKGLAVIINNEIFEDPEKFEKRSGTKYDAAALEETLTRLGFDVLLESNLTSKKMTCLLIEVATEYDHAKADCFVCVVLSHGDVMWFERGSTYDRTLERNDVIFGVDGLPVKTKFIIETFNDYNCPNLKGKPRLFFFQACRGPMLDHGTDIPIVNDQHGCKGTITTVTKLRLSKGKEDLDSQPETSNGTENDEKDILPKYTERKLPIIPPPLYKDCLLMYATPPGYSSWRRENGSWFIQSLCRVLDSQGVGSGQVSLLRALTQVSGLVALNYETNCEEDPSSHEKKQQPVIYSKLIKDVFLKRKRSIYPQKITTHYREKEKMSTMPAELRTSVYV